MKRVCGPVYLSDGSGIARGEKVGREPDTGARLVEVTQKRTELRGRP
jgi:hypothetical protein